MTTETVTTAEPEEAPFATDARTMALLRNDLRGLSKATIGEMVAELTERMGVDPALAPIDIIPTKVRRSDGTWEEKLSLYVNARGASELAKRWDLSDVDMDVDIREKVVIVKAVKSTPTGRIVRDVGASAYDPDKPLDLARAVKTATTSAHRRATMRAVGIFLTEPEGPLPDA